MTDLIQCNLDNIKAFYTVSQEAPSPTGNVVPASTSNLDSISKPREGPERYRLLKRSSYFSIVQLKKYIYNKELKSGKFTIGYNMIRASGERVLYHRSCPQNPLTNQQIDFSLYLLSPMSEPSLPLSFQNRRHFFYRTSIYLLLYFGQQNMKLVL